MTSSYAHGRGRGRSAAASTAASGAGGGLLPSMKYAVPRKWSRDAPFPLERAYEPSPALVNHVVWVLDASSSMGGREKTVTRVADEYIAHLAERSVALGQETRITIYVFSDPGRCRVLVFDTDVLRVPSIADLYSAYGWTALVDATALMLHDLSFTNERYGEHAYLAYVVTDGDENRSSLPPGYLASMVAGLPDSWTLAALVPDSHGVHEMKKLGFAADNVEVWDVRSRTGIEDLGKRLRDTSDGFMGVRETGAKSTTGLFKLKTLTPAQITASLVAMTKGSWYTLPVREDARIDDFLRAATGSFEIGQGFYELTKRVLVQASKQVVVVRAGTAYTGSAARSLLGLSSTEDQWVKPSGDGDYKVYVQSTAANRKLLAGTELFVLR